MYSSRLLHLDADTSRTLENKAEWTHHPVRMDGCSTNTKRFLQTSEIHISMCRCVHRLKCAELSKPQNCKTKSVQEHFNTSVWKNIMLFEIHSQFLLCTVQCIYITGSLMNRIVLFVHLSKN